jgi:outer membrane protein OmpA-like peptidoglycan-associated protein
MSNLLDAVKGYLTPELIGKAATFLGENESGVAKAAAGLAPTLLAGLAGKTGDSNAWGGIFNMISQFDPTILDNLGGLLGGGNLAHNDPKDAAGHLLGNLFGAKVPAITNAVSAFAGIKSESTSHLLGLVGPLLMGVLSKHISTNGLNASGFANLIVQEKSGFMNMLPTGVSSLLGSMGAGTSSDLPSAKGNNWLWPLLLLLALGGGIIYYMKNCTEKPVEPPKVVAPAPAPAAPAPAPKPTVYEETLPGGFKLNGALTGIESQLVAFIKDAAKPVDKTTWFNFDHLNFKTGSAELDMDYSKAQLNNIYEVLKAFPKVKIKIGGYTDNTGKEADNMKLSQKRADTVMNALITMGVEKSRLTAEGYGSQFPAASNDTEAGKAQNRRIAVRVTEK